MASSLVPRAQVMSDLLTIREKTVLFTLLEPQCKLIKTTVAQVLEAKDTDGGGLGWSCVGCGVVSLIEDESIHSHFLRLYCVKSAKLLWEQELYIPFQYTATRTFFHTFPADGYQVGFNFANETEAEEFHLEVKAIQRKQEKMNDMIETTTSDQQDEGVEPVDHHESVEQHLTMDASFTTVTPASNTFKDLDPAMKRLLMQAKLTEEDLKDKDIAEAVDCIINKFGGLKAVQRELNNRGSVSKTLPRAAGASVSLVLKKGPLPPVPAIKSSTASQQTPEGTEGVQQSSAPPAPVPVNPERLRKSASFKHVGSSASAERSDLILTALKEVFRQRQLHQEDMSADGSPKELGQ
ncbi:neural Wiskott-Aldrich syndrome protein isoform X2 [Anabas testudineus]|uniref:WH1 domain-containing protein n=1 Tax=Anabas testudineus TaxID=64144 RepID=A0A3Q1HA63_ANATE|nr:neural Wiskott-Aldrich syndrome protein isoform X2 [Anabas testudineus]